MKPSLLIIGHGSKSPEAAKVFNNMVDLVRQKNRFDFVEGAHMSLSQPGIDESVASLARRNVKKIIIMPYFLYEGMHLKHDIPKIMSALEERYSEIEFIIAKPIGFDPILADIIIKRAYEVEV